MPRCSTRIAHPSGSASSPSGKITLLTFFYTYCVDPWGCPYAYWTLSGLSDRLIADPQLARGVRFVSVSFDPTNDTPEALRRYGARFMDDPRLEWQFLTAPSVDRSAATPRRVRPGRPGRARRRWQADPHPQSHAQDVSDRPARHDPRDLQPGVPATAGDAERHADACARESIDRGS